MKRWDSLISGVNIRHNYYIAMYTVHYNILYTFSQEGIDSKQMIDSTSLMANRGTKFQTNQSLSYLSKQFIIQI